MSPIENVLSRLSGVKGRNGRWSACCPAHEDRSPSLSIREVEDGKVLLHCFGGCGVADIAGAIGLDLSDLFPPKDNYDYRPQRRAGFLSSDLLKAISLEATVVAVCAAQMGSGQALSETDRKRLLTAAARINEALEPAQ